MMVSGGAPLGGDEIMRTEPPGWNQHPYNGDPRELPHPFLQVRTRWEDAICEPGKQVLTVQRLCWHADRGHAACRAVRNQCLLFMSCQVSPGSLPSLFRVSAWSLVFRQWQPEGMKSVSFPPHHVLSSWDEHPRLSVLSLLLRPTLPPKCFKSQPPATEWASIVNPDVNYGLWVMEMCQQWFINYNKCPIWWGMLIMGKACMNGDMGYIGISGTSSQLFCKPKIAVKLKNITL